MKFLFVVEHFYPYVGGAEELFLNLTTSLVQAGNEVQVVTTLFDDSVKKSEEYKGIQIKRINCYNRFLFTIMSLPKVIRIARTVDLIHTTSYNSAIPAFLAGLLLRKKVIITFHEVWGKLWLRLPFTARWKLWGFYLYEWLILKLPFHKYIAVSEYTRKSLMSQGISENKIVKIYNGLDYAPLILNTYRPPEKFTFCFFGRLGISKGLDLLLEATQTFITNRPEAKLKLIIPTYPTKLFRKVMQIINLLPVRNNIILLHNLSKEYLLKEVSTSSCVIIPSYSEGFCFVAAESAGMGVPVISSGQGSLPEVVSGKLITLKELNAESINQALEKALINNWENKPIRDFTILESMDAYISFYQSIIKK